MKKPTDLRDVFKLIKFCKKHGIQKFEGFGFHFVLGTETMPNPLTPPVRQTKASIARSEAVEKDALMEDNQSIVEEQLDMLLLENPGEYERLLREGELEDAPRGNAHDRGTEPPIQ